MMSKNDGHEKLWYQIKLASEVLINNLKMFKWCVTNSHLFFMLNLYLQAYWSLQRIAHIYTEHIGK